MGSFLVACNEPEVVEDPNALTINEQSDLLFLIEEEKLARDVYTYAYGIYGSQIYSNIKASEQTHMDRIAALLVTYKLENPTIGKEQGEFVNTTLQALYADLTAKVDISLLDALVVGATIEDLDLHDIDDLVANTTKSDILLAYEDLTCGSKNHMRAFVSQIKANGGTYNAQFISEALFNEILAGKNGKCN